MSRHDVTPARTYWGVFAMLLALTAVTVSVAEIDLGAMNVVVALAIAVAKASLVVFFFMGLRFGARMSRVAVVTAIVAVLLLIGLSLDDVLTRTSRTYLPYDQLDGVVPGIGLDGVSPSRGE
jgi:cytochrome c oxidase subunit IV